MRSRYAGSISAIADGAVHCAGVDLPDTQNDRLGESRSERRREPHRKAKGIHLRRLLKSTTFGSFVAPRNSSRWFSFTRTTEFRSAGCHNYIVPHYFCSYGNRVPERRLTEKRAMAMQGHNQIGAITM